MKRISIWLLLLLIGCEVKATDCEGYIIKTPGDSIKGIVDVVYTTQTIDGEKQFVFGDMWMEMKFAESGGSKKKMKAGDIAGYGFKLNGKWYHFEVLDLEKNYGRKIPKMLKAALNDMRFYLHRVYEGALPVYREYWDYKNVKDDPIRSERITSVFTTHELYVKTSSGQFMEISPSTGKAKKLKGFLQEVLKLEDEFINTLDDKLSFDQAEATLKKYNDWKRTRVG